MRQTVLLLLALALPGAASAEDLLGVYNRALENDPQLQAAGFQRDAALQARPLARSALLPQLNANGAYARDRFTLRDVPDGSGRQANLTAISDPYNYGLTLSQAVFNREAWMRLKQSDDQVALAEATYAAARQSFTLRVTEAYFNVLAAADSLRFAKAENEAVSRQLEQAQKRFEVGLSAITDVQEAQARYDLTNAQLIEAERVLRSARDALAEITGQVPQMLATLQAEIPLPGPDPADLDAWIAAARADNLDLLAAEFNADIAQRDIKISASGHWPTLTLNGNYTEGQSSGFNRGNFDQGRITLQANIPIYSGGATHARVRQSNYTWEQRKAELERARRQVERVTRDAYDGVRAGASRVKALKQAVVSNQTALEASDVGLEVGTRTAVDVLNAQQQLYSAQRDYARARYDYLLNVLRLKQAAGRLSEQDLAEINRLLVKAP